MKNNIVNWFRIISLPIWRYVIITTNRILDSLINLWPKLKLRRYFSFARTAATLYLTLYSIAWARYELSLNSLNNKVSNLYASSSGHNAKAALERVPFLQKRKLPREPELFNPLSVFFSLQNKYNDYHAEPMMELRSLIVNYKRDLSDVNLNEVKLQGSGKLAVDNDFNKSDFTKVLLLRAELNSNSFSYSRFTEVDFGSAKMSSCNFAFSTFIDSEIGGADFMGSNFCGVKFTNTYCGASEFIGSNLIGVDLSHIPIFEFIKSQNFKYAFYNSKSISVFNELQWQFLSKLFPTCTEQTFYEPTRFSKDFDPKAQGMIDISDDEVIVKVIEEYHNQIGVKY